MSTGHLSGELLDVVLASDSHDRYEYTGSGYFLTVKHPGLPSVPQSLIDPPVSGVAGLVQAGFVVHLGEHELTLECHTWGEIDVPEDFRDLHVEIASPPANFSSSGLAT